MENYEVVTKIGKGSSGSVFLAKSLKFKKLVAIKEIEIDENRKSRCKKSVVREASILQRLTHPFIVECNEWFMSEEEKLMHIVLEYCNGGTMHDMVRMAKNKNEYFPENKILKWMTEITSAVAFMHERKILHRDLKTENVFLVKPDIAKLGDFGISKEIDHTLDLAQTCVGTPCYLSPELCQDIPYNSKSDIWALGCLLFEVAALKPAFDAANLVSLFYKIVKGDFAALPTHCSEDLHDLVRLILQKDPEQRPSAVRLLEHPILSEYLDSGGTCALTTSSPRAPVSPLRERRRHKPPKLAESRHRSSAVDQFSIHETQDTITNDTLDRTMSPSPSYAYNMFISGVKSKSTLDNTTRKNITPATQGLKVLDNPKRSCSVLDASIDKMMVKSNDVPRLFSDEQEAGVDDDITTAPEVETARPQTCPHSASRRVAVDYVEDTFTDTVVTWSGYGDRGSRHPSGHTRRRDSISLSSGSEHSSSSDYDAEGEASSKYVSYENDKDSSDSSSPDFQDDSGEISEELVRDDVGGDDEIPEVIEDYGDTEDFAAGDSIQNEDLQSAGDNARILPGSAWLRSKRIQVMQRNKQNGEGNGNNVNNNSSKRSRRKARLPGSSWLSRKGGNGLVHESSSDDAIVLGQDPDAQKSQNSNRTKQKSKKKSGRIRNLPGSAWLKNSQSSQRTTSSDEKNTTSKQVSDPRYLNEREKSLVLESCSSANELSNSEQKKYDSDIDDEHYSYPDDFDEYEDDFEASDDDDSDNLSDPSPQKSSLSMVRQGCIDLLGEEAFEDLSSLFQRGLTLSEVIKKFKKRKVDIETLETCYLLLQKKC